MTSRLLDVSYIRLFFSFLYILILELPLGRCSLGLILIFGSFIPFCMVNRLVQRVNINS